ncbi:glucose-6-phosphate isomerase [Desulfofalx alkaliphila]|uniref:glucose-6-phosphate isomerase n=1 Tax=Desulfofalx alkaliphila TaxID=105483 RepID=UPI0004E245D6|nr:glucose-6-phosphate isomerase [Desulfofalx alkaliphila]
MTRGLTFDYTKALNFVSEHEIEFLEPAVNTAHRLLHSKTGPGSDYTGWVEYPKQYDKAEFERIKLAAEQIKDRCDALVVIGIGGSYIGARSALEMLGHTFYNQLPKTKRKTPEIYYVGNNISPVYTSHLLELLEGKELCVNIISKSGTTTEPAIAFRIFRELLTKRYGKKEARKRIYATTDKERGALKKLAAQEGYQSFVIPDQVGGRYSVLTAVGLLPIAVSGADIDQIMSGAADAMDAFGSASIAQNYAYQYAAVRKLLYQKGKTIELMVNYEPSLHYFSEWWKQLFGESEGKDGKGIFPASVNFSTDLHSMGQYIQDGRRNIFETVIHVQEPPQDLEIMEDEEDIDGLNFLTGKTMDYVNKKAFEGTMLAHTDGGVPNLLVKVPKINEYYYGQMVYFFEKACGISGYLLGVNPFNQPGVEAYKKNMFALLGKSGYEKEKAELEKRLKGN